MQAQKSSYDPALLKTEELIAFLIAPGTKFYSELELAKQLECLDLSATTVIEI